MVVISEGACKAIVGALVLLTEQVFETANASRTNNVRESSVRGSTLPEIMPTLHEASNEDGDRGDVLEAAGKAVREFLL